MQKFYFLVGTLVFLFAGRQRSIACIRLLRTPRRWT